MSMENTSTAPAPRSHTSPSTGTDQRFDSSKVSRPATAARKLRMGGGGYVDGRSWAGRRIRTLTKEYVARLGVRPDAAIEPQLRATAELVVVLETRRAALLNGEGGINALDRLIRLEGELRRRMRRLGLDNVPAPPPRLSLRERLLAEAEGEGEE